MANPAAVLAQLTDVAKGDLTGPDAEDALTEALEAVRGLRSDSGWTGLEGEEVSAVALTRALGDILKDKDAGLQGHTAALYAALLGLQDTPVGTLCEPYAFTAFLNCLRSVCLPTKRDAAAEGAGDAADEQASAASALELLEDVGVLLRQHSLRGNPEMFKLLLDMLVDFTGSPVGSAKPEKGNKRGGGAAARNQGVAEAAFALLPVAMDGRHGDVLQIGAMVCHRLVPVLLGVDTAKRGGWDRRGAALNLINNFLGTHDAARPCRIAIMRRLCLRAPDKADCRQMAVTAVQALIPSCTADELRMFCLFLYRLSRTPKGGSRIIAVDLAGALLASIPAPFEATGAYQRLVDGSCRAGEELEAPWSAVCLAIVVSRSNDKSASVRGKAISCLADCAQSFSKRLLDAPAGGQVASEIAAFLPALCASRSIQVQVAEPRSGGAAAAGEGDESEDEDGDGAGGAGEEQDQAAAAGPPPEVEVTAKIPGKVSLDLSWMRSMCHARCRDEKAVVRKVALQLLESVLELCAAAARGRPAPAAAAAAAGRAAAPASAEGPTAQDVQVLEEATADSLVSVRKAALQVVCNLVACYPHHADLACVWARCVLPLLRDPESSVQETVLDRLNVLLLEPLALLGRKGAGGRGGAAAAATSAQQQAEAEVRPRLAALAVLGRSASSCMARALAALGAKKLLKGSQVAAGLEAFLMADREAAAAEDGAGGAGRAGARRGKETEQERLQRRTMRDQREGAWLVLVEVAGQDPAAPSWQFLQRCWSELQAGGAGAGTEANAQAGAMLLWVISHAASRFPAADAADLASGLLKAILGFNLPCAAVAAHLAALHKLTQSEGGQTIVGPPAKWCAQVQEACEELLTKAMDARGNMSSTLATHCQLALFTFGEVALLRETALPNGAAVKVQALTYARSSGVSSSQGASTTQSAPSAHAWTCLGKMCMVDEALAKKCVPLLVQEMSTSPSPVVRTNLLVGLADMVVQFTGLADAYVGRLAAMVRDPHELVRRQALALLANLLLRDYVKWRGALVHRFLLALVDESPGVRELGQYLLSDALATKAPMLAYNHFIESLFVLNDCSAGLHAGRGGGGGGSELASELKVHSAMEGGKGFHLKGNEPIMRTKRDIIYTVLLRRMSPEQRFSAFARLNAEVLAGVNDGVLPLAEAEEVLGDALRLMACKDMRVNASKFGAQADEDATVDQLGGTQEDATKQRGKLVGAMMKKHLCDHVVPQIVELRFTLKAQKHELNGPLMACLATLLRDYKYELEDILVADRQLAVEITYDLKQCDAKQHQQQQEAAMAATLAPNKSAAAGGSNAGAAPAAAAQAKAASASSGASMQAMMPPPSEHADRQRRKSVVLPGVEPGRTPLVAEVLATANKRGRAHTPHGAAGPSAVAMTPAPGLQGAGAGTVAAMRTPLTGLLGTAQRGRNVLLSPAPLSTKARAVQQQRAPGAAAAVPGIPRARPAGGAPAGAEPESQRVTVILPSPLPSARPLGPHNLGADTAARAGATLLTPGKAPQRTPMAEAVRAAQEAAAAFAAAMADENDDPEGAAPMDVDGAGPRKQSNGEGKADSKRQKEAAVKEEADGAGAVGPALPMEWQVPEVKKEEAGGAARGGKGRSSKRRQAA